MKNKKDEEIFHYQAKTSTKSLLIQHPNPTDEKRNRQSRHSTNECQQLFQNNNIVMIAILPIIVTPNEF